MRNVALILNTLLLAGVAFILFNEGSPKDEYVWLFAVMIAAPVLSMILLRIDSGNDWLSLLLRRNALEEKLKIEQLKINPKK